jgi:hypothetical protein
MKLHSLKDFFVLVLAASGPQKEKGWALFQEDRKKTTGANRLAKKYIFERTFYV